MIFAYLEVLSVVHVIEDCTVDRFLSDAVFPPTVAACAAGWELFGFVESFN